MSAMYCPRAQKIYRAIKLTELEEEVFRLMLSFLCQELSASSCVCDTSLEPCHSRRSTSHRSCRRHSIHNNNIITNSADHNNINNSKMQCHSGEDSPASGSASPGLSEAYRAMVGLAAGKRTPSIELSCCLTETTDCPCEASVIPSIRTIHGGGGGRRPTAISLSDSTTSSSVSSSSCSKELSRCGAASGGFSRSKQDFRLPAAAAYSRSEEDLIQRVPDSLGGPHRARDAGVGQVCLPAAALRNLVRERLREEGISLSPHPYTLSVGLQ